MIVVWLQHCIGKRESRLTCFDHPNRCISTQQIGSCWMTIAQTCCAAKLWMPERFFGRSFITCIFLPRINNTIPVINLKSKLWQLASLVTRPSVYKPRINNTIPVINLKWKLWQLASLVTRPSVFKPRINNTIPVINLKSKLWQLAALVTPRIYK